MSVKALSVFFVLFEAERAFKRDAREVGWTLLEKAEQMLPTIESDDLFVKATEHADRVWTVASPELPRGHALTVAP